MLALHPRLVTADDAGAEEGRACYCVVVACVSLLLFLALAATVSVAKAGAITGAVVLLLGLLLWVAPDAGRVAPRTALPVRHQTHHRCACGLSDAAIAALPTFAYQPPTPTNKGGADEAGGGTMSSALCAVCLEDVRAGEMVRQLLPACTHLFHADCVDAWLRAHRTCPLCRRELFVTRSDVADKASSFSLAAAAAATTGPSDEMLPPV